VLEGFDHHPRTRLVFGVGAMDRLGELAVSLGGQRALVVTDPGVKAAGHLEHALRNLRAAGLEVEYFDEVIENPTTACVDKCAQKARSGRTDLLVGLGGGSSLDTAKGCNFILTNGGRMQDYWGVGKATQPMLPLIAIPTTAGTGSECQSFALITDEITHRKMACGDPKAAARVALLDPLLTLSQPFRVAACAGMDTLAHAVETAVTRKRNPVSMLYSFEAFRLAVGALPTIFQHPDDVEARGGMLLAAAWAGTAIELGMLGAAHAAANPLTAHFGLPHGEAVSLMLPQVVRFNAEDAAARQIYFDLAWAGRLIGSGASADAGVKALVRLLEELPLMLRMPMRLAERNVTEQAIPQLAEDASREWTGSFNPRPVTPRDFERLYRAVR
jgi:alcohol dehydrogenase